MTYFLQKKIFSVLEYEWNEWEMRRKAIKLANLRKCVTHSTQTVFSNFKRENETQVYLPKDNWGQTKRDGDTSVPKLKTYYHGLRYIFATNISSLDCTKAVLHC